MPVVDQRDINFVLEWLALKELFRRPRFAGQSVEDVAAILTLAEQIGENELAPHLRAGDVHEPNLRADGQVSVLPNVARAVRVVAEAGLFGTAFDAGIGGLQLPHLVHSATLGVLMAGNLATASFMLLTVGNARLIAKFGTAPQVAAFAKPQIAGMMMGTMCLSEAHAGSSLGDIRTRAIPDGEDDLGRRFRLYGNKMWISGGDHDVTGNIVHLVLAKVPDEGGRLAAGSRGISLFVVPKILPDGTSNDVTVAGLNHKMGYRALPNCALNFGEGRFTPEGHAGAIGWLIGDIGQGLPQMFQMMNEARISVGLAGAMLACRGYLMSLDYARQRPQGRPIGTSSGDQVSIIQHADVRRMLLAQKAYSQGALSLVLYSARLLDDEATAPEAIERENAAALLAFLTPITKSWPSEWAQVSLHHALQIHGGAGYTLDFEIELLYRDNRLNPIHEGTTGIQAIDLAGRKLRRDHGASFRLLDERIRTTIEKTIPGSPLAACASSLADTLGIVRQGVATLLAEPSDRRALAHATPLLQAIGHLVVGWLWLDQALLAEQLRTNGAEGFDPAFLAGRISACRYFAEAELPLVAGWLKPLLAGSELVLELPIDEL